MWMASIIFIRPSQLVVDDFNTFPANVFTESLYLGHLMTLKQLPFAKIKAVRYGQKLQNELADKQSK